jgi:hypothetical protein
MSLDLAVPLGQINLLQDISPLEVARALAALLGASDFPIVEIEVLPKLKPRHGASRRDRRERLSWSIGDLLALSEAVTHPLSDYDESFRLKPESRR